MKKVSLYILTIIVLFGGFLRLFKITEVPPGLYIDEVSIGLNAYDILTTGKDQYGIRFPLTFKSFGDYKMPLYIYAVSGTMAVFGKNEFAVRFPSALAGTLTILIVYLLYKELLISKTQTKKYAQPISLLAAGLLAISPWHIHFSRGGFEVTLAVFFYATGVLLALYYWHTHKILYLLGTSILFACAMYTYHSYRLIVPFTVIAGSLVAIFQEKHRKNMLLAIVFLLLITIPIILFSFTANGQVRFLQTVAFADNPYKQGALSFIGNFLVLVRNYLSYFSITYLFTYGDQINRHQVNNLGILYIWQIPFIISGIFFLIKTSNKILRTVVLFLLLIGPIPASLALPSPHTLRFLLGSIPYTMLTALGIYQLFSIKKKWIKYGLIGIGIFALIEFTYYLQYYYVNYPKEALIDWGGSCKEIALDIQKESKNYQHIVIEKNLDCVPETFYFYIPHIPFTIADVTWFKPNQWGKILYVRTYYGNPSPDNLLYNVSLHDVNHTIFAQFFTL